VRHRGGGAPEPIAAILERERRDQAERTAPPLDQAERDRIRREAEAARVEADGQLRSEYQAARWEHVLKWRDESDEHRAVYDRAEAAAIAQLGAVSVRNPATIELAKNGLIAERLERELQWPGFERWRAAQEKRRRKEALRRERGGEGHGGHPQREPAESGGRTEGG
jgi:hypothetical protein